MSDNKNQTAETGGDYMRPLRRRWWLIAVVALVAAAGAYRYYSDKPVVYQASTSLYMQPGSGGIPGQSGASNDPTFLANQAVLIRTPAVAAAAARYLHYTGDPSILLNAVTAAPEAGTDFLQITATAPYPADASRIADAFARAYVATQQGASQSEVTQSLQAQERRLASIPNDSAHADERNQVASVITQLQLAQSLPTAPAKQIAPAGFGVAMTSSPSTHALYGLALGLLIGIALAYVLDALDRRIKVVGDIEPAYGRPVIATVPTAPRRVCRSDPRSGLKPPLAEAFRGLRTTLELRSAASGNSDLTSRSLKTIMVASAVPDEGKSTIVRNLALAYLEAGQRVVVVDCDLRRPDVSRSFGVDATPGLPEVLVGEVTIWEALQTVPVEDENLETIARVRQITEVDHLSLLGRKMVLLGAGSGGQTESHPLVSPDLEELRPGPELAVLPSTQPRWNPAAVLGAPRFESVLECLRREFDVVLIDTAPLTAVSDAAPLLPLADGVLIVSRIAKTPLAAVREMNALVARVPRAHVIGVVANDVRERSGAYAYGGPGA